MSALTSVAQADGFLAAMAEAPGESTHLLVYADWLDEHDRPRLAAAIRQKTPQLVRAHRRAAECIDALLSVDLDRAVPVKMPRPDRGQHRSRKQWVSVVRTALKPFAISHLTVAVAPGWRSGPDIEMRVPAADFSIGDGHGDGIIVPWEPTSAGLLAAGTICFAALMPRVFPGERPRVVHFDGDSFETHFWRVVVRPTPTN